MQNSNIIKDINPIMLPIIYEISLTLFISYIAPPDGIAPYRSMRPLVRTKYHNLFLLQREVLRYYNFIIYNDLTPVLGESKHKYFLEGDTLGCKSHAI